jgi:hypothetical protein
MEENHVASSTLTRTAMSNVHCTSPESGGGLSATDESFNVASYRVVERAHDAVDRLARGCGMMMMMMMMFCRVDTLSFHYLLAIVDYLKSPLGCI